MRCVMRALPRSLRKESSRLIFVRSPKTDADAPGGTLMAVTHQARLAAIEHSILKPSSNGISPGITCARWLPVLQRAWTSLL